MMNGRLTGFTVNRDGTENLTITGPRGLGLIYDELKDEEVSYEIKKAHKRRSLDANAYAWVLVDQIAEKTGIRKSEIYREAIREIGGCCTTVCVLTAALDTLRRSWEGHGLGWQVETMPSKLEGCTNVTLYYGSSVFDSAQMSRLIDILVQDAEALGIPTITPEEEMKMLGRYKEKHGKEVEQG